MILKLNVSPVLQPDDVIVFPEAAEGWYEISSKKIEWALPGSHPLAIELSKHFSVLSTTHIEGEYDELTVYENGRVRFMHLNGLERSKLEPEVSTEDFGDDVLLVFRKNSS